MNYTGCIVFVYDMERNLILETIISGYDEREISIEVPNSPKLADNSMCEVFILTAPTPYAYEGRVRIRGISTVITLFRGHEKESRRDSRYKLAGSAAIDTYICDGKQYPMHTPVNANLINISRNGIRFGTKFNALSEGDRFKLHLCIAGSSKYLTAEVINAVDRGKESSEYGCHLVGESEG